MWSNGPGQKVTTPVPLFPPLTRVHPTPLHREALFEKVMPPLQTGYGLRGVSLGDFIIVWTPERTYTNLDAVAHHTPRLYGRAHCSRAHTAGYRSEYCRQL